MPITQAHPVCAVCNVGRSSDRVLLQCQNRACSSGEWFHPQCIGSAIVSLNVKKTQHRWLCPWCLLQQSSSLSERQILALTLHISHLDSVRSNTARPVEHLVSEISSTNHSPSLTSGSGVCSSIDVSNPSCRSSSCNKKRRIAPRDVSAYPGTSDNELSGTCAKCRRTFVFTRYVFLRDLCFCSPSSGQWYASPQANQRQWPFAYDGLTTEESRPSTRSYSAFFLPQQRHRIFYSQ